MADIHDVRVALWRAYQKLAESGGIDGKSSEGYCELLYPTIWDAQSVEEFCRPEGVMVYSYALGPNRQHYFWRGPVDRQKESNQWFAPDPFAKAVKVIEEWEAEIA